MRSAKHPPPSAAQEIRQSRGFAHVRQEALVSLLLTADRIQRYLRDVLGTAGVTHQQYNVLRILRGAGGELPTMAIRERMIEQAPGITALLKRLEGKRLIKRRYSSHDRRMVHCQLTNAGRQLLRRLDPIVDEADRRALGGLSVQQVEQLIRLLDKGRASVPKS